jgi:hypothetical protein
MVNSFLCVSSELDTTVGSIGVNMGQQPCGMLLTLCRVHPERIEAVLGAKGVCGGIYLMFGILSVYLIRSTWFCLVEHELDSVPNPDLFHPSLCLSPPPPGVDHLPHYPLCIYTCILPSLNLSLPAVLYHLPLPCITDLCLPPTLSLPAALYLRTLPWTTDPCLHLTCPLPAPCLYNIRPLIELSVSGSFIEPWYSVSLKLRGWIYLDREEKAKTGHYTCARDRKSTLDTGTKESIVMANFW